MTWYKTPFAKTILSSLRIKVAIKPDSVAHVRYRENCFRDSMVPSFIPLAQAKKILAIGKSINFLREICQDHTPVKGREELKRALESTSGESVNFL
jgi:gamma-tubulin complex component 3